MANSNGSEAASPAVISRRDAIIGALALAAGSLIASAPEVALAADGGTMFIGSNMVSGSPTSITRRTVPGSDDLSYVFLNHNLGDQHIGVYGSPTWQAGAESIGVYGLANTAGHYGVLAEHDDGGTALKVVGKASFQRSGRSSVSKGKASKTVTGLSGVATTSMILVTLQGSGGSGVYLKYAARVSSTSFKVVLNKACTSAAKFAWMIVD